MNVIQKYKEFEIYFQNADHIDVKTIESDVDLRSFISDLNVELGGGIVTHPTDWVFK